MKEETPTFYRHDPDAKRTLVDLPPFLHYLDNLSAPDFATRNAKNIEDHLLMLAKTPNAE
jgi:hypothetical protein